jgi:hypothetical protein
MAIISTQNKKKLPRNYCRSVLLIASALTVFAVSPLVAQAKTTDQNAVNIPAQSSQIAPAATYLWINPESGSVMKVPMAWTVETNAPDGIIETNFENKEFHSAIKLTSDKAILDVKEYVTFWKKNLDDGSMIEDHSHFGNNKESGKDYYYAIGHLKDSPNYIYRIVFCRHGDQMRKAFMLQPKALMNDNSLEDVFVSASATMLN